MDRDKIANLDPESILRALPDRERETFLAEHQRFLRLWALRAVAVAQPGYYERLEKVRSGDHSGGMSLEDALRDRAERLKASIAEGEQAMASGEPMVTLDDVRPAASP
jgi:hypothetical protein